MVTAPSVSDFCQPGPMTDLGSYRPLIDALPVDLPALVDCLQHLVVHIFWAKRYGLQLTEDREKEVQLRPAQAKLARLLELDDRPLNEPRPLDRRLVCNCRDITTLLCAIRRAQGYPARARCGFATYFIPNHYEDHWVAEVWDASAARWVLADAQLDTLQREVLGITFDPLNLPPGQFINGGAAWQLCQTGQADPDNFGIFEWHGWDFVRGNVLRDCLALTRVEVLPWDFWGLLNTPWAESSPADRKLVDDLAAASAAGDASAVQAYLAADPRLPFPSAV